MIPAPAGLIEAPWRRRTALGRLESLVVRYAWIGVWQLGDEAARCWVLPRLLYRHPTGLREALHISFEEARRRAAKLRSELVRVRGAVPLPADEPGRREVHALAELETWLRLARVTDPTTPTQPEGEPLRWARIIGELPPSRRVSTVAGWMERRHDVPGWWNRWWQPPPEAVDVGPVERFPNGHPVRVEVATGPLVVVHDGDRWFAASALCPHRGGPMDKGRFTRGCLVCPIHEWSFDLTTGACGHGLYRLPLHDVRVEEGRVRVFVDPGAC